MKADLHIHTRYSGDSLAKPKDIIKAARRKNLDAVAITDHGNTNGWKEMKAVSQSMGFPVILGEEIKTVKNGRFSGEILGLFLNGRVEKSSPEEVIDKIKEQGGIAVLAHPFEMLRMGFRNPESVAKKIDAVEVFNSKTFFSFTNNRARRFARENGLAGVAGSDAHVPWEVGNAYTAASAGNLEEFRKAILKKQTTAFGKRSHPLNRAFSVYARFRKLLK